MVTRPVTAKEPPFQATPATRGSHQDRFSLPKPQVSTAFRVGHMKNTPHRHEWLRAKSGNFPSPRMSWTLAGPHGPSGEFLTSDLSGKSGRRNYQPWPHRYHGPRPRRPEGWTRRSYRNGRTGTSPHGT